MRQVAKDKACSGRWVSLCRLVAMSSPPCRCHVDGADVAGWTRGRAVSVSTWPPVRGMQAGPSRELRSELDPRGRTSLRRCGTLLMTELESHTNYNGFRRKVRAFRVGTDTRGQMLMVLGDASLLEGINVSPHTRKLTGWRHGHVSGPCRRRVGHFAGAHQCFQSQSDLGSE